MKLSWHFQRTPSWAPDVVNDSGVEYVKVMYVNPNDIVNQFPDKKVIARPYILDGEANQYIADGNVVGYYNRMEPFYEKLGFAEAIEGPNEPPVGTPEQRKALSIFSRKWAKLMLSAGHNPVVFCLSVGWPDVGTAGFMQDALAIAPYWAVHEYSAPTMYDAQGWRCLRYRRTVAELWDAGVSVPPLLITECGIDGGVIGQGGGWKRYCDSRSEYFTQLCWYDKELQRDDYVKAAFVFTSGPEKDWASFDFDGGLSRLLANYTPYVEPEPEIITPTIEDIREAAWNEVGVAYAPTHALQSHGKNLGAPMTGEFTIADYVVQGYTNGIMYVRVGDWSNVKFIQWNRGSNEIKSL